MEQQIYRKKIVFWLRFAGWLCLLPAGTWLRLFNLMGAGANFSTLSFFILGELVIIILFAIYLLVTAESERWLKPANIFILLWIAILFISLIVFIPLYLAYRASQKMEES